MREGEAPVSDERRLRELSERSDWIERHLGPGWVELESGIYELQDEPPPIEPGCLLRVVDPN